MADKAWRDMWGGLGDLETGGGVVCSIARRSELKLTCKMRAACGLVLAVSFPSVL